MDVTKELIRQSFDKYGCDKGSQHDYANMYREVFSELSTCDRMLEIGFGAGRSALSWRDILPNTELTFLDRIRYEGILDEAKDFNLLIGNSARASVVSSLFTEMFPFDLIIDDGDHRPDFQWQTFLNFEDRWTGLYVIEDIIGTENEQILRRRLSARGYEIRTHSSKLSNGRIRMNGVMQENVKFYAIVVYPKGKGPSE